MRSRGALILAVIGLVACARPAQLRYEEELRRTPPPARHAVHGQRLAELMRGLERLAVERLPQALDPRETEERRSVEVAAVARAMATSADRIPEFAAGAELDAEARREFLELAGRLGALAKELEAASQRASLDAMRAETRAIRAVCARCHERFRIPWRPDGE